MTDPKRPAVGFSDVVGQDDPKLALLLAAVEPRLGGVLLRGEKGSAKTTLARGLADLMAPDAPFVEIPLGATEDRVLGSVDVQGLLSDGKYSWRPGLLAAANGGVLYVDEINLLADHLVDALLDAAATGQYRVERDGVSHVHQARFVLIGSMNPEEGELRPQLLDRFGLTCEVRSSADPNERAAAVRRVLASERGHTSDGDSAETGTAERLETARVAELPDRVIDVATRVALAVGAEGLRADLSLCRAGAALAGWEGRRTTDRQDLRRVAAFVLGHRRRRTPFESPGIDEEELDQAFAEAEQQQQHGSNPSGAGEAEERRSGSAPSDEEATPQSTQEDHRAREDHGPTGGPGGTEGRGTRGSDGLGSESPGEQPGDQPNEQTSGQGSEENQRDPEPPPPVTPLARGVVTPLPTTMSRAAHPSAGARSAKGGPREAREAPASAPGAGRRIRDVPWSRSSQPVAPAATAMAAAVRQATDSDAEEATTRRLDPADLRTSETRTKQGRLIIIAVDASGSMVGAQRVEIAKQVALGLLTDAYQRRDRVALVAFRGSEAEVVLRPTGSVEIARNRLADIATGGATPLAAGLQAVADLADLSGRKGTGTPVAVLITDGRATVQRRSGDHTAGAGEGTAGAGDEATQRAVAALTRLGVDSVVVDAEAGPIRLGLASHLAERLGARYVRLDDLSASDAGRSVEAAVRSARA